MLGVWHKRSVPPPSSPARPISRLSPTGLRQPDCVHDLGAHVALVALIDCLVPRECVANLACKGSPLLLSVSSLLLVPDVKVSRSSYRRCVLRFFRNS